MIRDYLAGLVLVVLIIGAIVGAAYFMAGHDPSHPAPPHAITVRLDDGTTVRCVDGGYWGACDFVGYVRR